MKQFSGFERDGLSGFECKGKTAVVVGVGNVGYEMVKIARGLEMKVFGVDIDEKHSNVKYLPIGEAIEVADVIFCAMNLTGENHSYFNYNLLSKAKPGVFFVNIARGEMSPSGDLLKLIDEGYLGGLALDVYENEAFLAENLRCGGKAGGQGVSEILRLAELPNVILTPHNAFNTLESTERKAKQSIQQVNSFLKKGCFLWEI